MYISNTSFFVEPSQAPVFEEWARTGICNHLGQPEKDYRNPRLSRLEQAADGADGEAASFAFQLEFTSLEDVQKWNAGDGAEIVEEFMARFAPQALTFVSVSKVIPLKPVE